MAPYEQIERQTEAQSDGQIEGHLANFFSDIKNSMCEIFVNTSFV